MSENSNNDIPTIKQEIVDDEGKSTELHKSVKLDDVLVNELGQFGRFQLRNILLVTAPIIMSAFINEYVFSSAAIPHRCRIPECGEDGKMHDFEPKWILNAIPKTSSGLVSCERYVPLILYNNRSSDYCPSEMFNKSATVACDEFVYKRNNTVVYEFDLGCQDWLRALAGTLISIGTLLVLPITGYISDRFGRKIALVINVFNMALIGLIRGFSVNYTMYLVLQITQTTLGAGTFSSAYVIGAELVGPKYRVLTNAITSSMFSIGQITLGTVAWLIPSWRYMIIVLHIPCFLVISYYWILSDSVRWLLSKGKFTEAKEVLETVARVNKTHISEKSLQALTSNSALAVQPPNIEKSSLFRSITRSPILLRRVCTTPFWWVTATCVYYGLSITSTSLSDRIHLNYILTSAIEIPGNLATIFILDKVGRKATLSCSFFCSSFCNVVFVFISKELYVLRFATFLLGKFCISIAMSALYLYTSELYPTEFRHSLLAFSSMIGRIGYIVAPLTPVLANYWHGTPSMLFGVMGIISGILVFTQPDTTGIKLPDTLTEAEALGQKKPEVETPGYRIHGSTRRY